MKLQGRLLKKPRPTKFVESTEHALAIIAITKYDLSTVAGLIPSCVLPIWDYNSRDSWNRWSIWNRWTCCRISWNQWRTWSTCIIPRIIIVALTNTVISTRVCPKTPAEARKVFINILAQAVAVARTIRIGENFTSALAIFIILIPVEIIMDAVTETVGVEDIVIV
jgi:hypothetical protein